MKVRIEVIALRRDSYDPPFQWVTFDVQIDGEPTGDMKALHYEHPSGFALGDVFEGMLVRQSGEQQ